MPDFLQTTLTNAVLSTIGFIVAILLVVIGFFIRKFITDITNEINKLTSAINTMSNLLLGITKDTESNTKEIEAIKNEIVRDRADSTKEHKNIEGSLFRLKQDMGLIKGAMQ